MNGLGTTSADWDPSFIDRLASSNELILLNNRGIGGSTDDGQPFDIAKLAADAARVIETLGIARECDGGGFIAQALALNYADRVDKLVLLSTDSGGIEADLASPDVWSGLVDTSGMPNEQARRLLFLLFPTDVAESFYRQFGDIVAAARAQLSPQLLNRQAAAMDAWHHNGVANQLREIRVAALSYRNGRHCDSCFKRAETGERNSLRVACSSLTAATRSSRSIHERSPI